MSPIAAFLLYEVIGHIYIHPVYSYQLVGTTYRKYVCGACSSIGWSNPFCLVCVSAMI